MGQISFFVPMVEQGNNPICWIACVAMVTSAKKHASVRIDDFTGGFDPSSSCIPNPSSGWADFYARLDSFGFSTTGGSSTLDADVIEDTLRRYGPFLISVYVVDFPFSGPACRNQNYPPRTTHTLVVSGIDTDAGTVSIVNPWGTAVPPVDTDVAISLLQAIANTGCDPIAFMR
jgi:hypothetical protein